MKNFFSLILSVFAITLFSINTYAFELPDKIIGISVPKPTAEIVNFDIDSISLNDITLLFDVAITNPYPVKLKLSTVKAKFFVDNKQFFQTSTDKLKIKARGTETTNLKINIKYADMAKIVKDYANKDFLECLIDITIVLKLPDSVKSLTDDVSFNFRLKKNVPTIKPEINIANFKVVKPSKSDIEQAIKRSVKKNLNAEKITDMFGAIIDGKNPVKAIDPSELDLKMKVNFDIVMKNRTKTVITFQDLNYTFSVNSSKLVDGFTKDIQSRDGGYILGINNEFSSKALGKAILKAFKDGKGNYNFTGYSMVKFPDMIKKEPLKLNFNEKGAFNLK